MFKPNFKIGSFAPPQPPTAAAAPISSEMPASNSIMGSSNESAALPSTLPNKQPTAAETGPLGSIADDDIAEEVEYDEVIQLI